jgi:hypothetical protein
MNEYTYICIHIFACIYTGAFFIGFFGGPLCYLGEQLIRYYNHNNSFDFEGVMGGIIGGTAVAIYIYVNKHVHIHMYIYIPLLDLYVNSDPIFNLARTFYL